MKVWTKRFLKFVLVDYAPACWLWQGKRNAKGYGLFTLNHRRHYAHRMMWILHDGDIPDGMVVRHSCDVPACVNPVHLRLGTIADNNWDTVRRGRNAAAKRRADAS